MKQMTITVVGTVLNLSLATGYSSLSSSEGVIERNVDVEAAHRNR